MDATVEVVKTVAGRVVYDEVFAMTTCPECGDEVASGWARCPSCGAELGGAGPLTCENVGNETLFECSACGRRYVPAQVKGRDEEGPVEWNRCPGCGARVVC